MVFYRTTRTVRYLLWMLVATLAVLAFGGRALAATSETANEHDGGSVAVSNNNSQSGVDVVNVENRSTQVNESSSTVTSTGSGIFGTSAFVDNSSGGGSGGATSSGDSSSKKAPGLGTNEKASDLAGPVPAQAAGTSQGTSLAASALATQAGHYNAWHSGSGKTQPNASSITNSGDLLAVPASASTPIDHSAPSPADLGLVLNAVAGVLQNSSLGQIITTAVLSQGVPTSTAIFVGLFLAAALLTVFEILLLLIQLWRKNGFVHAARAGLGDVAFPIRYFAESFASALQKYASSLLITYFVQNKKISVMCNTNLQGGAL